MKSNRYNAVYIRVSSSSQDVRSQEGDLRAWAERAELRTKFFEDTFTGVTMNRPGFNKLIEAARRGEIASIVVWRLDRLGRTVSGLATLFEELQALKVNLVSLKDSLDLSTPAGRLMANVLVSVAAYETEVRKERQTSGIARAKEEGKRWGGRKQGENWKVNPEQINVARAMKAEGRPITLIAETLGLSRPTIYRLLQPM